MAVDWSQFKPVSGPVDWSQFKPYEEKKEGAFARAGRIARDEDGGVLAAAGSLIEAALPDSRAGRDTTVAALKSAVGVPQSAIGLIDIASGGRFGRALEQAGIDPNAAQRALDELYSPETQAAKREVQAAEGFTDTAGAMLRNPSTILTGIGESIAPMLAGGVVGRGAAALSSRLSPAAAAAIGEGALMAGQSASQIRGQTEDGLLTPTQSALAAGAGVVGGLIGRAGGALSNRAGIGDVDTAIVQGGLAEAAKRPGFLARTALGAGIEGGVEEMPQSVVEQAAQNVALGKPWDEGLGSAAAQGLVVGAPFGAVGANLSRPTAPQAPAPAADPLDAQAARMTAATDAYLNDRPGADTIASIVSKPTVDEAIDALGAASPSMEQILADKRLAAAKVVADQLGIAPETNFPTADQVITGAAIPGLEEGRASVLSQSPTFEQPAGTPGLQPSETRVLTQPSVFSEPLAGTPGLQPNETRVLSQPSVFDQPAGTPGLQPGQAQILAAPSPQEQTPYDKRRQEAKQRALREMSDALPRFRYTPSAQGQKKETLSTELDLVSAYVEQMRQTNTPAAQAFVRQFETGRITPGDVQSMLDMQNPQLQAPAQPAIPSNATPLQAEGIQIEQMRRRAAPTLDLKQPEQAVAERAQAQRAEGDATPELTQQRLEAAAAQGRQQDPMTPVQVGQYIDALRLENTPQARALVQEYEAGRVTDQDVADAVNAQRRYQLGGVDLAQNRIETAATQGAQQAPGLQVERSGARAPNAALAEAVQMYGDMPLTARDMTVEGASERLSRAAAQARQTPESLIQVGDTTQTSRVPFRGRNEAIRTSNEGLDAAATGRGGERMTAPRPTLIGGKPPGSYTDQQLKDLVGNDLVPAITRRGAETELAVRALQQRAQAPAAPAAPGTTSPGGIILASAKRSPQDVLSSVARSRESKVGRPVQMTVVDTNTLPAQRGTGAGALSRQAHTIINNVSRVFGKKLVVFESDDATAPDGFYSRDDADTIYLNRNSETPHLVVFGHELLHSLRKDNEAAYQALVKTIKLKEGADISETPGIRGDIEEFTADLMGNQFRDNEFWVATFRDIIASKGEQQGRQVVTRLAAAAVRAVNGLMKALGRAPGYNTDEMVANLGEVKAALRSALSTYAKDRYGAAVAMERERVAAAPAPAPAAAAAPATTVAPTATEDAQASEKRVEGPFKPARTMSELEGVRYSLRRADFVSPEDRQEVSTTRPVPAPKKGRTSNAYDEKWVIDGKDVRASKKHVDAVMRALREYNTLSGKGNAPKLMQELHDVVVENLLWLHDLVPENVRARAKLWYDGANRIANDWTSKYGVSLRQSSGVLAVLSPQMDWFMNVSLGERVISIWKNRQNEAWSPAMTDWLQSWVNASKDVDTKASRQAILDEARPLQGMTLAQMSPRQAALYVRVFDETYHERQYRLVTPEGGFGDYVTNSDDGDASVTWGGFDTIEKAISILNDGSFRNVEEKLGDEHKVRNFYNNIINPGSADGHVTIDTHAVAAALVKALSGSSREVSDNFGAAGQNAETGASGTYGLFADAYRDAAAKRGILPREMQSIAWEAVRALFPASIKDQLAPQVDAVWDRFRKGEITRDQAREEVRELAGGVRKMAWEGSDAGAFAADGGSSFNAEIAENPADRTARTLPPEVAKDKLQVNLSANTSSVPGIAALQAAAAGGDMLAHRLIQDIALDNLRHLLSGTSARVKADGVTGLYGGYVESGLSMTVTFADDDRTTVLAALAKFADNFNQEQVHVRRGVKAKPGTAFDDGSYATPVYRWELKKPLSRKQIENVISGSGLYGLTFGDNFVEAYYVGDPSNEAARQQFDQSIDQAGQLLGRAAESVERSVERLWAYGDRERGLGFKRIRGDVPSGAGVSSQTANRVAGYLNAVKDKDGRPALGRVKTFEQAEITPEQDALQTRIAEIYQSLPDNDLKNPNVRKAYSELAREVLRQFKALPVKVEVLAGQGEPYKSSADMRRDVLDNNHLFIFGTTPETFGPPGEDFTGHPLLENSGLSDQNGQPLLYNDLLRAVHDYYAHTMSPTQFGPKGEEAAWKNHMSMTNNMWARWALTIETRGQNSWVNFRPDLERSTPISEREFARQKAALLPVEYSLTGNRAVDKPMKEFIGRLGDRVRQGSKPVKPAVKASEKRQTETPEFKAWFGDSKVVDGRGRPLVVYHGTGANISVFNDSAEGNFKSLNVPQDGIWFASEPARSEWYANVAAKNRGGAANIMPVYLSIQNPYIHKAQDFADEGLYGLPDVYTLKKEGYDGVIIERGEYGEGDQWADLQPVTSWDYAVFSPTQIKSAIGNRGAFNPADPDIRKSEKRQTETPEFKRWFGDSKVVGKGGKPLVVYHGTARDFSEFDFARVRAGDELGVFTTTNPAVAANYAEGDAGNVMPLYLSIRRPYQMDNDERVMVQVFGAEYNEGGASGFVEDLKRQGYDGIYVPGDPRGQTEEEKADQWIPFRPEQIKSAIGNRGAFDPTNPDIRASEKRNIFNQRIQPAWSVAPDTKLDAFLYKLQDKQIDLKRITKAIKDAIGQLSEKWDAYLAEELYHGRTAKQTKDFLQDELKPLMDSMAANRVTMPELEEYLHNRHAEERNRQIASINPALPDAGSGIATADARRYLAGLSQDQRRRYDALARQVDAINKKTRDLLVSSGLEKQDTIDAWEKAYPTYVPLFREDADYDGSQSRGGTGLGFSVRGPSSKRATGSADREVVDILANVALMRERTITRAEKTRVGRALYGLAVQNPNPGFWLAIDPKVPKDIPGAVNSLISMGMTAADARGLMQQPTVPHVDPRTGLVTYRVNPLLRNADHVMSVRVDGEDKMLVFNPRDERAQRMVTSLKNLDAQQLGGALSAAAFVSRWFAQVNTQYNPVFGAINLIRDVGGAAFNLTTTDIADRKAQVMAGVGPALVGIYQDLRKNRTGQRSQGQWAQLWEEFQREGGQTGFRDMFSRSDERAVALQRMLDPSSWAESPLGKFFTANGTLKAPMEVVRKGAAPVFNLLSDYNETLENAVRLSAYKAAKDKGLSNAKAASIAKNLTVNFNRKGQVGVQMGALYAFFNASVQGTARLAETLGSGRDPNASAYSPNRYMGKTGQRIIAGGLLLGVMQAVALAMAGFDEDEPPEFIKERNLVIPLDWVDNLGGPDLDGKYLTIPMPLGLNVIPNTGRVLTEWWMSGFKDTPKRVASITGSFLEMFNPIGNAGWSVQTIAPTFADPLVALSENRDWTGKPIAKEDRSGTDPTPGYTRAKDTASIISKGIAYALNAVSGGTDYKPGVVSPTPDQIDYLIGQVTGGVGREVLKVSQAVESGVTGEDLPTYKIPVAGRFYGDIKELSAVSSRYYDNLTRMNQHENEIKGRAADRVPIGDYFEDNPEARLVSLSNRIEREVSDLRRRKRELIKREASKESIKMAEEAIRRRMQSLNDAIERAQKRTPNNGLNP